MKNVLLIAFLALCFSANAQQIETKKVFGGYIFAQNEKNLSHKELTDIMKNNQQALDLMQSAKTNRTWSSIFAGIGGGLIGYPIGTSIGGGDPEWALAAVGAGLIVVAIPIANGYNRKIVKAVNLFNENYQSNSYQFKPEFDLNIQGTSIGFAVRF